MLFRTHSRAVLTYSLRRVTKREDAADVVAEVMLAAWRRSDAIPAEPETRFWLLGVARNVIANQARSENRRFRLGQRLREQVRASEIELSRVDHEDETVRDALAQLPEIDREILLLTTWEELTPSEAASVLDIHPAAARTRLHRARARLRTELEPAFGGAATTVLNAEEEA